MIPQCSKYQVHVAIMIPFQVLQITTNASLFLSNAPLYDIGKAKTPPLANPVSKD